MLAITLILLTACGNAPKNHEHTYGSWTVLKEATCLEEGMRERVCSCGEKERETLQKTDHNYGGVTPSPDCAYEGTYALICKDCSNKTPASPELTHSFGEWKIVKEATEAEEGLEKRTCHCGAEETRTIAKKGT